MKSSQSKNITTADSNNVSFFQKKSDSDFFGNYKESFFTSPPIQTKLTIGQPNDKYEQEADVMADKVVQRLSENQVQAKPEKNNFFSPPVKEVSVQQKPSSIFSSITPLVQARSDIAGQDEKLQKKDKEEEPGVPEEKIQKKPIFESNAEPPDDNDNVQRKCAECEEEKLQKKDKEEETDLSKEKLQKKPIFESNAEHLDENNVQRKCAECEQGEKLQKKEREEETDLSKEKLQKKPVFESNAEHPGDKENIQRKCDECEKEEKLQKKADTVSSQVASSSVENTLSASKGSGTPIAENTRTEMEGSFGADFSAVRIHNDSSAVQMSKDLNAQAFTHGSDIYFNAGKYDNNSNAGKHLLAHELTHVVQQGGNQTTSLQRWDLPALFVPNRDLIDEALASREPIAVQRIRDYSEATVNERLRLIEIVLNQSWVGPLDEDAIEEIWDSFGEALPDIASTYYYLWEMSSESGAEVDDLEKVESIKEQFKNDVREKVIEYLNLNREYILEEMGMLGITEAVAGERTEDQLFYLREIEEASKQVRDAQRGQMGLKQIVVGYEEYYSHAEDNTPEEIPAYFNPDKKPTFQSGPIQWEEVKVEYDKLSAVIAGLGNRYPAVYALIRNQGINDIASDDIQPGAALTLVRNSFLRVLQDINETVPKIDNEDMEYYDFVPIHQQLFQGSTAGYSGIPWNNDFYKWVAKDDLSDHESHEFWIQLGFSTLAAAAFIVAELATAGTATFFIAAGVGVGISAGQAAFSWENYLDLAQAARTNVSDETALVTSGQADAAFIDALINTVFAFVDLYAPAARLIRAGAGSTAKAVTTVGREELLANSRRELAEEVARELRQRQVVSTVGEDIIEGVGQKAGQSLARDAAQAIRRLVADFIESVKNWAKTVFERFGFKSYEVIDEGEWIALYGIRSHVLLARFKKQILQNTISNDPNIDALLHSRVSQQGAGRAARASGNDVLAITLRQNVIELSEEIGEEAAELAVKRHFPGAARVYKGHGSGTLDLVFKMQDGSFIVVEAKGGRGRLINRQISAGVEAQQGTVTYLRSVLDSMSNRGEAIAIDLIDALGPPRKLKYILSQTPVPRGTVSLETTLREFL